MAKISDEVFYSDAHRLMMRDNFVRRGEQLERSQELLNSLYNYGSELNSERLYPTYPYVDSFGNKFKFVALQATRSNYHQKQSDDGTYKNKVSFNIIINVNYQFYGDQVPRTVLTEPVEKMWETIQDKFSEYGLDDFFITIGVQAIKYVLQDSDMITEPSNLRDVIELPWPDRVFVKCDETFEYNLMRKLYVSDPPKIIQPEFNREYLDKKYNKIYNVLRKGTVTLNNNRRVDYELEDVGGQRFNYSIIPTGFNDKGDIMATRPRVRLTQNIRAEEIDNNYNMEGVKRIVRTKFKQLGIDIELKEQD
jgi:hypothetical protein